MDNSNSNQNVSNTQFDNTECIYTEVDQSYWAKMPFWTVPELACVTLGFRPEPILTASLDELMQEAEHFESLSRRAKLSNRAQEIGQLKGFISPKAAIDWLRSISESVVDGLEEMVTSLPVYGDGLMQNVSPTDIGVAISSIDHLALPASSMGSVTKEIASLKKIILATAVGGYGYAPKRGRSSVYGEIANDAALIGLNLHTDTVRKYIVKSVEEHWVDPEG